MKSIKAYIVDSFTDEPFKGNPAGVCLLEARIEDDLMLLIAKELGLSETAFIIQKSTDKFDIRFFSPVMEIPLCGHATLAASKVVFERHPELKQISFTNIQDINLEIEKIGNEIVMKFPLYSTQKSKAPEQLLSALGISSIENVEYNEETNILILEIEDVDTLRGLNPNFEELKKSHDSINGVLITSKSNQSEFDFESRYFWPWSGTNEDPVTGGTHTFLTPYWSKRLNKNKMISFQCSERTGRMEVEIQDEQWFTIRSTAQIVFEGNLRL